MKLKKEIIIGLKLYGVAWLVVIGLLSYIILRDNLSASEVFKHAFSNASFFMAVHIFFIVIYILFLIVRYFIRVYRGQGGKIMLKQLVTRLLVPVVITVSLFKIIIYQNSNEDFNYVWDYTIENTQEQSQDHYSIDAKHRGMTVFGWRNSKDKIETLVKNNVEWVAIVPFFYQSDEQTVAMRVPTNDNRGSRRDSTFLVTIKNLKNKGMHIMLKPHLWLGDGWRSNVNFATQKEWNTWFDSYRKGILHYAKMANATNVDLLCIGTELKSALENQQEQWKTLVKDIKAIYKGQLTYAANWDGEYDLVEFWDELDYIGIQGYYPITKNKNPDLEAIVKGWDPHINALKALSKKYNKRILFTEIGYKNSATATIKPWEWGNFLSILSNQKSNKTQQLAYDGLYKRLWHEEWFAGTYIWQWNSSPNEIDFTPQNKPAQNTIAKWYGTIVN